MRIRQAARAISGILWVLLFGVYIAAKLDFIKQYSRLGTALYLREHSAYWAIMALIMFFIWGAERLLFRNSSH